MKEVFEKVDAIVIKTPDENFFYFTRHHGMWENSYAIIFPEKVEIIAPPLEEGKAHFYKNKDEMEKLLKEFLNVARVGFNGENLSYRDYRHLRSITKARFVDVSKEIKKMRLVKRKEEIEAIYRANRITRSIVENIEMDGKSEKELAVEIECGFLRKNAKNAFPTIVAFGKHTSFPHHLPSRKRFVMPALIDAGAKYMGYCADLTRSFVKGRGKKLYEIVEEALYMAIDEMEEGRRAGDVYEIVEKFFAKHGYRMRHALGHSIGINVHDGFSLSKKADFMLEKNMVFAVEPAVYLKNYGIRIEEDVVIKAGKARIIR